MTKKTIKVTCDVKHLLPLDKLTPFQGELKSLTEKKYEKLKASLLRHGFSFPEFVWKNGRTNYVLDGHQRVRALTKMAEDGITVEGGKIPIVYVKARNQKHAKELVLAATSQFGTMDEDSVYQFIHEAGLKWEEIKTSIDFAGMNMGTLAAGWFKDGEIVDDPDSEWKGMPEYEHEDLSSKKRLLIHFATEDDYAAFSELIGQKLTMDTRSIWFPQASIDHASDKHYK